MKFRTVIAGDGNNTGIVVPQGHCEIGNHDVPLMTRKVLDICHEHYNIFLQALEYMGQCVTLQQAGYWPDFMRLLRKAEGELEHGGESVRPGDPTGGN